MAASARKLELMDQVMAKVYGAWKETGWRPRPYKEGKGRYLWTDAFGVCNFLTLWHETHQPRYKEQAKVLVSDVHDSLGKTRDEQRRLGNATDDHPTRGGLRIGKPHPESDPDGDGQYLHYLTKWEYALMRMAGATGEQHYLRCALELAQATHSRFMHQDFLGRHMLYWKMKIDLSGPAVASMGNLDAFDCLVTYTLLQQAAQRMGLVEEGETPPLQREIESVREIVQQHYKSYDSDDPLDLGESMWLAHWQLHSEEWARHMAGIVVQSADRLFNMGYFTRQPHQYRLAFRECGTTLGIQALEWAKFPPVASNAALWEQRVEDVHRFWQDHLFVRDRDITPVMFASSLVPGVWLKGKYEEAAPAGA